MGNEMGNNNSTSDQFQEKEGNTKVAEPVQGKYLQHPVPSVNDRRISDGSLDRGDGGGKGSDFVVQSEDSRSHGNGAELGSDEPETTLQTRWLYVLVDHEEEEEESQQDHDGLPTAESPEADDDETTAPDSNPQPSGLTEEPEQLEYNLVELQEPFKQEEAERMTSTSAAESPNPEVDEIRSKDSNLELSSTEEPEQLGSGLVEQQELFKQEEAELLTSTSIAESPTQEVDETRSEDSNPQPHSSSDELEQHNLALVEEQESFKQEEAEMLNSSSTVESLETNPESDDTRSKDNNLQSGVIIKEAEELNSDLVEEQEPCTQEAEMMKSTSSAESPETNPEADETRSQDSNLEPSGSTKEPEERNSHSVDQQEPHKQEEAEIPNSTTSPTVSTSDDEEHPNTHELELEPNQNEGNSTSTILSPSQHEELPDSYESESESELDQNEGINAESSSVDITGLENGQHLDAQTSHNPDGVLVPQEEKKAVMENEDSPRDSSSNSSWEFNPGNGHELFADMAPTFVADREEPVVPLPIQLPAEVPGKRAEADQPLGRISTDSVPDNFSANSKMQKSPSFNLHLHLRRRSTEDYSDQTPLLQQYQDKNTILPPTKQTQTVESINYEEAMPAEEKVIQTLEKCDSEKSLILGRGKSNGVPRVSSRASKEESAALVPSKGKDQKHYSRRRPTIFGGLLCCTTTTAIN